MTSQTVQFQYWNGASFQTIGTFTRTTDVPSSTITFPAVTTNQIRFFQPTNQGNPTYQGIFWITEVDYGMSASFDFSLSNGGNKSVIQGQSTTNTITATLVSGTSQSVSFTTSGIPTGATYSYSPTSCNSTCSSTLTIATFSSTPVGTYTITVTGTAGILTHTSTFSLTVNAPIVNITNVTFTPLLQGKNTIPSGTSFTLTFYTPGTTTLKATAIMASDASGKLTFPSSVVLASGNYDILTATNGYLKKKQLNVALASNTTIALAQLTAGDFNSDNAINSLDWSVMNAQWFTNNSQSDINGDTIVNSLDFSYLNSNWNKVGD